MTTLVCSEEGIGDLKIYAQCIVKVLSHYRWLIDSYVLDYFVEDHWQKLPTSWQKILCKIDLVELSNWLNRNNNIIYKEVWPLSLIALRKTAHLLTIRREAICSPVDIPLFHNTVENNTGPAANWDCEVNSLSDTGNPKGNLTHAFRKHVKPKKQHEISRMAKVVSLLLESAHCKYGVDVGSGQGHLSRLVAFGYGLHVATLELVESHLSEAKRFDEQALLHFKKKNPDFETSSGLNQPKHVQLNITKSTTQHDLQQVVNEAWCDSSHEKVEFGIFGLHTCGDLGPSLLRLFVETATARAIASVGCCYMKLSPESDSYKGSYPMSSYVKNLSNHNLSYEALEIACHAIEMYQKKLQDGACSLKIHCYRAILEAVIVKHYPSMKHTALRSIKHAEDLTFKEYALKALSRFQHKIPEEDIGNQETELLLKEWKKVIVFYSLRLIMAPVVESLILLDRMIYLWENGLSSCLVPLFDPEISPRNHVLLAVKN